MGIYDYTNLSTDLHTRQLPSAGPNQEASKSEASKKGGARDTTMQALSQQMQELTQTVNQKNAELMSLQNNYEKRKISKADYKQKFKKLISDLKEKQEQFRGIQAQYDDLAKPEATEVQAATAQLRAARAKAKEKK